MVHTNNHVTPNNMRALVRAHSRLVSKCSITCQNSAHARSKKYRCRTPAGAFNTSHTQKKPTWPQKHGVGAHAAQSSPGDAAQRERVHAPLARVHRATRRRPASTASPICRHRPRAAASAHSKHERHAGRFLQDISSRKGVCGHGWRMGERGRACIQGRSALAQHVSPPCGGTRSQALKPLANSIQQSEPTLWTLNPQVRSAQIVAPRSLAHALVVRVRLVRSAFNVNPPTAPAPPDFCFVVCPLGV